MGGGGVKLFSWRSCRRSAGGPLDGESARVDINPGSHLLPPEASMVVEEEEVEEVGCYYLLGGAAVSKTFLLK